MNRSQQLQVLNNRQGYLLRTLVDYSTQLPEAIIIRWMQSLFIKKEIGPTNAADLILREQNLVSFSSKVFHKSSEGDIATSSVC